MPELHLSDDDQPFIRCLHCQGDSNVQASRCGCCGAPLETDAQREFNAKLWAQRRVEKQEEQLAMAAIEAKRDAEEQANLTVPEAEPVTRRYRSWMALLIGAAIPLAIIAATTRGSIGRFFGTVVLIGVVAVLAPRRRRGVFPPTWED